MNKAVQHRRLAEDRGKAHEVVKEAIKLSNEVCTLVDSNEASDWSKVIDLLHEKIPPKSDLRPRPKDLKAFFAGLPDDWKASYELSLPATDWSKERRQDVKVAVHWCGAWRNIAKETGNPVAIWKAYEAIRAAHLPVPAWILEYLDSVGGAFGVLLSAPPPPDKVYEKIAQALLMGAQPNKRKSVFSNFSPLGDLYLWWKILIEGKKPQVAIDGMVSSFKRDKRTVRRKWEKLRKDSLSQAC